MRYQLRPILLALLLAALRAPAAASPAGAAPQLAPLASAVSSRAPLADAAPTVHLTPTPATVAPGDVITLTVDITATATVTIALNLDVARLGYTGLGCMPASKLRLCIGGPGVTRRTIRLRVLDTAPAGAAPIAAMWAGAPIAQTRVAVRGRTFLPLVCAG